MADQPRKSPASHRLGTEQGSKVPGTVTAAVRPAVCQASTPDSGRFAALFTLSAAGRPRGAGQPVTGKPAG